ncbi:cytosine deaminase [Methanophagales archaeon]|jgi:mannose-6-phosphate isomerase-like protein (cupin superfamily)|nr:cytosine deaminase [Methanophagales archaeon]
MLIKDIQNGEYFKAIDNTILCELLHPAKEEGALEIRCSIAHAIVKPGVTTLPHRLKTSAEVYYILEGEGMMYINDESAEVHSGQAIYIPSNSKQYIQNTGNYNLKILCIVYPMWRMEDEEVL